MVKETDLPVIVANLNLDEVTWAPAYCLAAAECGLTVTTEPQQFQRNRLFIGDIISTSLLQNIDLSVYLLAAVEGLNVEEANISQTDLTLLASSAEVEKVKSSFSNVQDEKLCVSGFPINLNKLREFRIAWNKKIPKSVCFLGETRPVKNPKFELELVKKLTSLGYKCFHLSPRGVGIKDELQKVGAVVIEGIRNKQYLEHISQFQYVVSTSFSESLYISGIEAVSMGAIPILPNQAHSGFKDWCPIQFMYDYPNVNSAVQLIREADPSQTNSINLKWYDQSIYFQRVIERMNLCQNK